jgi:bifunctional DNA-binding transcriptional regulator/antitoxin component of YhaV-PrlF toxin-antitoxin module
MSQDSTHYDLDGNEIEAYEGEYPVLLAKDILNASQDIDTGKVSEEILVWLEINVEHFIDSDVTMYKVPLDDLDILEGTHKDICPMTETTKLQNLYRAIDDRDEDGAVECRNTLDAVSKTALDLMPSNPELSSKLFERMAFYYQRLDMSGGKRERAVEIDRELREMGTEFERVKQGGDEQAIAEFETRIVAKIDEGKELVKYEDLGGRIVISKLDYEAFSVGVTLKSSSVDAEGNIIPEDQREILKEYVMPEGFMLWFEILFSDDEERPLGLF